MNCVIYLSRGLKSRTEGKSSHFLVTRQLGSPFFLTPSHLSSNVYIYIYIEKIFRECFISVFLIFLKSRLYETEDIIFVFVSVKSQVYSMNVRLAKMSLHFIQQFVPVIEAD